MGAEKKSALTIKNVKANDKIILITKFNNYIQFFGYTMVDKVYFKQEPLYDYYFSKKKLSLKGIKYFTEPILGKDVSDELSFVKNKKIPANYFKSEYREISKEDFNKIMKKANLTKKFPPYFEKVSLPLDDFILNTILSLYNVIKSLKSKKQIEIKKFLVILKSFLDNYEVSKSLEEIQEFYAKNVWKLNLKHNPSRDPEKFVELYTSSGSKRNFSYISLE